MRILKPCLSVAAVVALAAAAVDVQAQGNRRGGNRPQNANALKVGQLAPTFDLKSLETDEEFNLAEYRGERPVLLFFGSYT